MWKISTGKKAKKGSVRGTCPNLHVIYTFVARPNKVVHAGTLDLDLDLDRRDLLHRPSTHERACFAVVGVKENAISLNSSTPPASKHPKSTYDDV